MLNRGFRDAFAINRLRAIEEYDQHQKQQFHRPLDLNIDEVRIIISFPAQSPYNFILSLEEFIIKEGLALI